MNKLIQVASVGQRVLLVFGWLVSVVGGLRAAGFSAPVEQASSASNPINVGTDPGLEWPTLGALAALSLAFWAWTVHARKVEHRRNLDGPESHLPS